MSTYFEDYQEHIQRTLSVGGRVETIDAAMDEYNATGLPVWDGSAAFTTWVNETQHTCSECRKPVDSASLKAISPRDEKLCLVCSKSPHGKIDSTGKDPGGDA